MVLKITFKDPWSVSVKKTDVLQILFCKQQFPAELLMHTNSEGCLELIKNVPLQIYETELTIIFAIIVFVTIVIAILLAGHIKDLFTNSRVFPFISLILTPIIIMHVFTVDVNLAEVTKLLIMGLF
jgi:hypothetical protein